MISTCGLKADRERLCHHSKRITNSWISDVDVKVRVAYSGEIYSHFFLSSVWVNCASFLYFLFVNLSDGSVLASRHSSLIIISTICQHDDEMEADHKRENCWKNRILSSRDESIFWIKMRFILIIYLCLLLNCRHFVPGSKYYFVKVIKKGFLR